MEYLDTCYCGGEYEYVLDIEVEAFGCYAFDCKECGEDIMVPKDSKFIIRKKRGETK